MAQSNPVVNYIIQGARARGLDPAAVLAVASQEGLSGRIGDGGHAYGPFQLNNAGGVITGTHPGVNSSSIQAWASSPAGINFALDRIASVAKGLRGRAAVNAIVRQFERPANPDREVQGAIGSYGQYSGLRPSPTPSPSNPQAPSGTSGPLGLVAPVPTGQPQRPSVNTLAILNEGARMFGLPPLPDILATSFQSSAPLRLPKAGPAAPSPAVAPPTQLGRPAPARGKPSIGYLEHIAAPFGLTITSTTGGKHAPHSYHYQGRAVDFGGDPSRMSQLAKFALSHPSQFVEVIYTGPGNPGFSILDGKVIPNSQLPRGLYDEHTNHVHLAR